VVANEAIDGGLLKVKYGQPFRETWEENWRPYLPSDAVNVLTAGSGSGLRVVRARWRRRSRSWARW
jgi:hypothetical protein